MVTASVEMDLTLCCDIDIGNQICVLVATQGDGTPLNPSFFKEQNVVELCIRLGLEHPEGVLWLMDTEAVLVYWYESDMIAVVHHLTLAMVWQGKPIRHCILPPKGKQVREYVTVRSSHQYGTQMYVQDRGVGTRPLPTYPPWTKGIRGPGNQPSGRTNQGCPGPGQESIVGGARGPPN